MSANNELQQQKFIRLYRLKRNITMLSEIYNSRNSFVFIDFRSKTIPLGPSTIVEIYQSLQTSVVCHQQDLSTIVEIYSSLQTHYVSNGCFSRSTIVEIHSSLQTRLQELKNLISTIVEIYSSLQTQVFIGEVKTIYNSRNSIVFIDGLFMTVCIYNSRNSIVFIDPKGLLKTSQS